MPTLRYIDTHCHLAMDRFADDYSMVADASLAAGVGILCVGGDLATSRKSLEIAKTHSGVLAGIGVHPCDAGDFDDEQWEELVQLAKHPRAAAIGETGLDYYWKNVPHDIQQKWFERHIALAIQLGKPLSVHARESAGAVLATLEPYFADGLKAIWHCFTAGKKEIGPAFDFAVKNHLYLAIGGLVTFEDQKTLREFAKRIPDELLLLETDAPFIIPRPKSTDRNDPRGVIRVAEVLSELRGVSPEEIACITTRNALDVLGSFSTAV